MKKWFCEKKDGLSAIVKIAAFTAGQMVAQKNPELVKSILPVANGILESLDNGTDNAAINAILNDAIEEVVQHVADDPIATNAIYAALELLKIEVKDYKVIPFELVPAEIKDLIDSFVSGLYRGSK
jgi:hypothetical protein